MLGTKSFCVLSTLTANLQYHECTQCRTTRVSLKEQFYLLDLTPQQSPYFERISYEVNPTLLSAPHALHIFICSSGEQRWWSWCSADQIASRFTAMYRSQIPKHKRRLQDNFQRTIEKIALYKLNVTMETVFSEASQTGISSTTEEIPSRTFIKSANVCPAHVLLPRFTLPMVFTRILLSNLELPLDRSCLSMVPNL